MPLNPASGLAVGLQGEYLGTKTLPGAIDVFFQPGFQRAMAVTGNLQGQASVVGLSRVARCVIARIPGYPRPRGMSLIAQLGSSIRPAVPVPPAAWSRISPNPVAPQNILRCVTSFQQVIHQHIGSRWISGHFDLHSPERTVKDNQFHSY
jgi:hypothetical protein